MSNLTTISTRSQEGEFKNAIKIGKVPITKAIGVSFFNSTFMCEKIKLHSCDRFYNLCN